MVLTVSKSIEGKGVQIMSIDNLPTELPLAASEYFSQALYPWIKELVLDTNHPVIQRAAITTSQGLTPAYSHLARPISTLATPAANGISVKQAHKVLLLGSGYVSKPLLDYLTRNGQCEVTVASNNEQEAQNLVNGVLGARCKTLDVNNQSEMTALVKDSQVVVRCVLS